MNTSPAANPNPNVLTSALLFFGGLTLILVILLSQHTSAAATSSPVLDEAAVQAGRSVFMTVCAACHGPKATGIQGLGKPLVGSLFFNSRTDEEMLAFLQTGRSVTDPLNTTGVTMPARGGRLTLTDTDLLNVIAYIRSLNSAAVRGMNGAAAVP
ncbi:MAG: cytochrome c [Anaerolineae bacterium]|nr:cytochrome c [Anaerolineae bacterium]